MSESRRDGTASRVGADPPKADGAPIIDVQGLIRQASSRVAVDQLVKQGKKCISILSRGRVEELINHAVRNILDKYRAAILGVPLANLQVESQKEFAELFDQVQQTAQARSELQLSKSALDAEVDELREDLERQKAGEEDRRLEEEWNAAFAAFQKELDDVLTRLVGEKKSALVDLASPEAAVEIERAEGVLRPVVARLAAAESARFQAARERRKIALYEKRLKMLLTHVAALERALRTLASSKPYSNQQIQNLLRDLGLAQDDKNLEKKKEMLKIVLQSNQKIRVDMADLAKRGITLASPNGTHPVAVPVSP